jgi:hypothetical protein
VVGQTLPLEHVAASPEAIGEGRPVAVEVEDRRPYVVSGDKAATFVG